MKTEVKENQEVKEISFNEDTLIGVKDSNNQLWLGAKQVCLNIGLSEGQTQRQITNLQSDIVLSKGVANLQLLTKGGLQNTICIKEDFVTLWLAKIRLTPTMLKQNQVAVDKLIKYQMEAQKVLHKAFMGTEEKRQNFYNDLGLERFIEHLEKNLKKQNENIDTLSTCAAVFQNMMEYSTINYKQQQELLLSARKRINHLLGRAHSVQYKKYARIYFKNLWLDFCSNFNCSTYKDLNPLYMDLAREYIQNWKYK